MIMRVTFENIYSCFEDFWEFYLINYVEDIVVFLGLKVLNPDHFLNIFLQWKCANHFCGCSEFIDIYIYKYKSFIPTDDWVRFMKHSVLEEIYI